MGEYFVNEVSKKLWGDRYRKNEEEFNENLMRVARYIAMAEHKDNVEFWTNVYYQMMLCGLFFPAGRTMSNAGIGDKLGLNNCNVSPAIQNNIPAIFDAIKLGAITHKAGGGIGFDYSRLSPNGMKTHNDAIASGPVSFIDVFNAQTATIMSGSRRGANMGVLSVYHPDIVEFVTAKSESRERLKHFNLSVMVDDKFMKAVEDDSEIYLHWPVYDENGIHIEDESKWKVSKKVKAREIWDIIMKNAYDNGEPGIFFYDNMNKDNNLWYKETIVCSNPCFTGDMRLLTSEGYKTFEELEDASNLTIIDKDGNLSYGNKVWCSGVKDTVCVTVSGGEEIKCTPNHIFMLEDGTECTAENLFGKKVMCYGGVSKLVVSVKSGKKEKVYDFTENNQHWGIVEGVVVHNCAEYLAGTVYGENPITHEQLDQSQYGGACNLGSLLLHNFVKNPFSDSAEFDYDKLGETIRHAVRMLDDVIDVNYFPDKIYENYQKAFRTIGLGVTGLADAIAMLGMKYNSKEANNWTDNLMDKIAHDAFMASTELAKEKGSFPFFEKEKFLEGGYLKRHFESGKWDDVKEAIQQYGIRNSKLLSVAPTGSMSMTYGNNCSSGIEPIFCLEYERKVKMGGQDDSNIHIVPMQDYAYKVWKDMGSPEKHKDVFVTALEMSVNEHVDMLATIAKHVDMSVSKTINIPTEYPFDDTKNVYMKCWKMGIKGCTIFRPNEIRQGIMITDKNKKKEEKDGVKYNSVKPVSRKKIGTTSGKTYCKKCACGTLYITVNSDESGNVVEAFVHTSKGGICQANINALTRMASLNMRSGVEIEEIVDQLKGITCPACAKLMAKGEKLSGISCPDILGRTIWEFYNENSTTKPIKNVADVKEEAVEEVASEENKCPECGEKIIRQGGCVQCLDCGWSGCD